MHALFKNTLPAAALLLATPAGAGGLSDPIVEAPVTAPVAIAPQVSHDERIAFTTMVIAAALAVGPAALIPVVIAGIGEDK
ncbi:hypothetical protein IV417_03290 [Alphaproteobacteria bacterium KMM 3653]|uniref:Uncharacterized protein n=1 Tax=Harenicola maris TaxID=2841044 RepID=A0AAP2G7E2_9RHOB|nr:hypothetical protein [Harenicola maris]